MRAHGARAVHREVAIDADSPVIPGSAHLAPVLDHGLRQPFLFMGDPAASHRTVASFIR